jgi:endonuclease/exonuclease/phosphatase (EEP) superfamily protein YafD
MTCNLLHEHVDAGDFTATLDRYDPDIVVTQELGPHAAEVLSARYPHHRLRPASNFTGRGIATRLEVTLGDIEIPGRPGTFAVLRHGEEELRLAGIHLLNPIEFPWWISVRTRQTQLAGLFEWLDSGVGPVVVAGDFNASPRWPAYRRMTDRLTDLVLEENPRPERTWSWRPGWPLLLRIDHVFGSGVRARNVIVAPVRGTDHAAVVVDIEVLANA